MAGLDNPKSKKMNTGRDQAILRTIQRLAWAAFLLALPVTSFPFFPPAIGGEALVRPLSLYPLIVLMILAILPRLFHRPIPQTVLTLLPFALIAVASSLLSLLRGIEPTLGISATARVMRGLSTLVIGSTFYLTIALLPETIEDLRFSLRWIYAGCALALLWGTLQAVYIFHFDQAWFDFLSRIQDYISIRRLLIDRISGLTYEPHWFAEQIILLWLPASLAAVLSGYTAFRWHWRWLTVELLLLGWSITLLPFTYSRAGVLNLVMLILLSLLIFRLKPRNRNAVMSSTPKRSAATRVRASWRYPLEVSLALIIVILPIYLIGSRNSFFARVWQYWEYKGASFIGYLSYLGFDARLAYSEVAYHTYEAYPVLGVGLGNYAFYFEDMLPYRPLAAIPEVMRMVTPEPGRDRLVTAKNFYLRLLAETGIVGTAAFMAFIIAHLGCALFLWLSPNPEWKYWGTASLFGLIAFGLTAFTFDSFVIPNMWIVFGLITAATRIYRGK
jgi:hypothetical protein